MILSRRIRSRKRINGTKQKYISKETAGFLFCCFLLDPTGRGVINSEITIIHNINYRNNLDISKNRPDSALIDFLRVTQLNRTIAENRVFKMKWNVVRNNFILRKEK